MVHHSKMAVGTSVASGVNIGKLGLRSVQLAASVEGPADLGWELRYVANHFVFNDWWWDSYVPNRQPDHGGTTGTSDQENRSSQDGPSGNGRQGFMPWQRLDNGSRMNREVHVRFWV